MKIYFIAIHYGVAQCGYYVAANSEKEAFKFSRLPAHRSRRTIWEREIDPDDMVTGMGRVSMVSTKPRKPDLMAVFTN